MSKKKTLLTILAVVLVCCIAVTGTLAYLTATSNGGNAVVNTFTAAGGGNLIDPDDGDDSNGKEGFFLKEVKVEANDKLEYSFVEGVEVDKNEYKAQPSTDLPKDPYVRIVGKTAVPAYLYVEVVDGLSGSGLGYTMASCWTKLDGVTGSTYGGQIYVYNNGELVTDSTDLSQIHLLDGNKITVGDSVTIDSEIALSFYGYLAQATAGADAAAAFNTCFKAA